MELNDVPKSTAPTMCEMTDEQEQQMLAAAHVLFSALPVNQRQAITTLLTDYQRDTGHTQAPHTALLTAVQTFLFRIDRAVMVDFMEFGERKEAQSIMRGLGLIPQTEPPMQINVVTEQVETNIPVNPPSPTSDNDLEELDKALREL